MENSKILLPLLVPILVTYISNIFSERQKSKNKSKRRDLWVKFLRSNKIIDDCLEELQKLESIKGYLAYFPLISVIIALFLTFKFIFLPAHVVEDDWDALASASKINLIPFTLVILFSALIDFLRRKSVDLYKISNVVTCIHSAIFLFIFSSNFIILLQCLSCLSEDNFTFSSGFKSSISDFILPYFFLLISILILTGIKHDFFSDLKSYLNEKFSNEYPFVHLTTPEEKITGMIQDIFDEDFIVLIDGDLKIVVEWDSISSLKLQEKKVINSDLKDFGLMS